MDADIDITKEARQWLARPVITDVEDALGRSGSLLDRLSLQIQAPAADRKQLCALIGQVKAMQKKLQTLRKVNWVRAGRGYLAVGHRPGAKLMGDIRLLNGTHILTLLSENEGSRETRSLTEKSGMSWLWFPMESARPIADGRYEELARMLRQMEDILSREGRIYIHCSAGIRHAEMIAHAFLLYRGWGREAAQRKLKALRETTMENIGEDWLALGDDIILKLGR